MVKECAVPVPADIVEHVKQETLNVLYVEWVPSEMGEIPLKVRMRQLFP